MLEELMFLVIYDRLSQAENTAGILPIPIPTVSCHCCATN